MCEHNFVNGQCTKCGKYDFAGTFSQVYSDDALEDNATWRAGLAEEKARKERAEAALRDLAIVAYKDHQDGKELTKSQVNLLVKFGYAYYTETTENEYGSLVIK